jgi:hypothetical protein
MTENYEKDFVPYEQALALKELGFDESCFGYYYTTNGKDWQFAEKSEYYRLDDEINIGSKFSLLAPLYQQAFSFFREKYNLREQYGVFPHHTIMINYLIEGGREEEAELECLKNLIEIVKQQTHATTN